MLLACLSVEMSNVQVKNIPEDLHELLRERVAAQHTTISDYVLALIRKDLGRPSRKVWLAGVMSRPSLGFSHEQLIEWRDEAREGR